MVEQRYRVIRRLEAGGMAEVFIGEATNIQGFKKQVAIKRVLPHLAQNDRFIKMFLDEARLSARLNHANIVSVFDIGSSDDTYFIVMEYIDGANLKKIMEYFRQAGSLFDVKEAVFICMEACRGLSYAHELNDDQGDEIGIVHRDISPPNILISSRGEVKVTDFGLAKATTQLEKTDPGVVKGKFSYLSPEAASGETVDARADIFSLGIVLWEMLAGRRLFLGENDYQTVKLVQQANIPRLGPLNPHVDEALEEILMRALARDPRNRHQSAHELGDSLAGYLFSKQLKVTSYDVANIVKRATSAQPQTRNDQSMIDQLIEEELGRMTSLDDEEEDEAAGSGSIPKVAGAEPLDTGAFENPANWFSELAGGDTGAAPIAVDDNTGGRWQESGLDELSSPDKAAAPPPPPAGTKQAAGRPPAASAASHPAILPDNAPSPDPRSSGTRAAAPQADPPQRKGGACVVVTVVTLLVLAAGAAAYFGEFIRF